MEGQERIDIGVFGVLLDLPGIDGPEDIFPSFGDGGGGQNPFAMGSTTDLAYGGNPFAGQNFWDIFAGGVNPSDPSSGQGGNTLGGNNPSSW